MMDASVGEVPGGESPVEKVDEERNQQGAHLSAKKNWN